MKKILLLALTALVAGSCKEISPDVRLIKPQPGERNVLIEEFTGVQCVNCPQGTADILDLQQLYGKNLIAVAIHAGYFARMYSDSKYDFKTEEGAKIEEWLEAPQGYPAAVVNRKRFQGEQGFQLGRSKWPGYIASEAAVIPKVKIEVTPAYNAATRRLEVKIAIEAKEDIQQDLRISVMLTEDDIVDPQADVGGRIVNYVHKHVLRAMLTNFDGNFLTSQLRFGDIIERSYSFTIPDEPGWWKPENMHIVAFASLVDSRGPGEVLNAVQASIPE